MEKSKKSFVSFVLGEDLMGFGGRVAFFLIISVLTLGLKAITHHFGLVTSLVVSLVVAMNWVAASYIVDYLLQLPGDKNDPL